jgi:hypothetical protein
MRRRRPIATLACLVVLSSAACSDSGTGPVDGRSPNGPVVTAPLLDQVPSIPIPSSPGADVPDTSETHVTISRLEGRFDFNPVVLRAYASWRVHDHSGDRSLGQRWSHQWSTSLRTAGGLMVFPPPDPLNERMLLVDSGAVAQAPRRSWVQGPIVIQQRLEMSARPFDVAVYVKRERQWELESFAGGSFHLIAPNQTVTLTEEVTEGSSRSQITTFGTTVTAGLGANIAGISAGIERTLSRTFSTSVTVFEERTRQVAITIAGEPGQLIDVRLWRLIDTYSLTDAEGNPITHHQYVFDYANGAMTWRTVAGTYPVQAKFRQ